MYMDQGLREEGLGRGANKILTAALSPSVKDARKKSTAASNAFHATCNLTQ
jgi:hypothetical protein